MAEPRCQRCGRQVPWITLGNHIGLTLYKGLVGWVGGSNALLADAFHSFTDIIGTSVVLLLYRLSHRPPDANHPYGHGKAEYMAAAFVYIVLLGLSSLIFVAATRLIIQGDPHPPDFITILGAAISIFANVMMSRLGMCAGNRNTSPALLANAFENRADAISSIAVVVGITLAILVHPILDAIAAMMVGVIIFANCVTQLRKAVAGLVDTSLSPEVLQRIEQVALSLHGVRKVAYVRTRPIGDRYWVDLGIHVPGEMEATAAEQLAAEVKSAVMRRSRHFQTVEVFILPQPAVE